MQSLVNIIETTFQNAVDDHACPYDDWDSGRGGLLFAATFLQDMLGWATPVRAAALCLPVVWLLAFLSAAEGGSQLRLLLFLLKRGTPVAGDTRLAGDPAQFGDGRCRGRRDPRCRH